MAMAMVVTISLVVVVGLWGVTVAQSDCNTVLVTLFPCLDYITGNTSTPSSACCSQLASVVSSRPKCLCEVVNGNAPSIAQTINHTLALTLPTACTLQTPPLSICSNASSTTASPAAGTPNSPSGSGSNTVPSITGGSGRAGDSSHGNSIKLPSSLLLFFLFLSVTSLTFILTAI